MQSWNIFEKLMTVCSPPEFFHQNMSHKQLLFTWSIFRDFSMGTKLKELWKTDETVMSEQLLFKWSKFRDSSMGTKLKYFWKTHESVKSAWIFSQKHVSRTMTFHVIHITRFYHWYKIETFLKNSWKCVVRLIFFAKTCLTNNCFSCDPYYVILAWV